MFRRSLVRLASEARQPRIKFPDRKASTCEYFYGMEGKKMILTQEELLFTPPFYSATEHTPHPHPAAPQDIAKNFDHFQEVFQSGPHFNPEKVQQFSSPQSTSGTSASSSSSSSSSGKGGDVVEDVHDLPKRFWATPALVIEENEMDAIMSGGATLVQK